MTETFHRLWVVIDREAQNASPHWKRRSRPKPKKRHWSDHACSHFETGKRRQPVRLPVGDENDLPTCDECQAVYDGLEAETRRAAERPRRRDEPPGRVSRPHGLAPACPPARAGGDSFRTGPNLSNTWGEV
jgi:hypothetical protein